MTEPTLVPAIGRAMAIIDFVAFAGSASATSISAHLGLAKSSLSDLVGTMLDTGLLQRIDDRLVVGPAFSQLSAGFLGGVAPIENLRRLWRRHPLLHEHTISLQTLVGARNLCVDVTVGIHLLPYNPRAGMRTDIWSAAGGEPVLRSLSSEQVLSELERFHAYAPAPTPRLDLTEWVREHARGVQTEPLLARTGNLEINVALSGSGVPPAALTLHVPPDLEADFGALRAALVQLAERFTGDSRGRPAESSADAPPASSRRGPE